MIDAALNLLGDIGYVLDTPGAYTRGLLAGRPGERVDGREMLEALGLLGKNQEGLDTGDVLGFGAEMLLDPLNLIAAPLAGAKGVRGIQRAINAPVNASRRKLLDAGLTDALFYASPLRNEPKEVSKFILDTLASSGEAINLRNYDAIRGNIGLNPLLHKDAHLAPAEMDWSEAGSKVVDRTWDLITGRAKPNRLNSRELQALQQWADASMKDLNTWLPKKGAGELSEMDPSYASAVSSGILGRLFGAGRAVQPKGSSEVYDILYRELQPEFGKQVDDFAASHAALRALERSASGRPEQFYGSIAALQDGLGVKISPSGRLGEQSYVYSFLPFDPGASGHGGELYDRLSESFADGVVSTRETTLNPIEYMRSQVARKAESIGNSIEDFWFNGSPDHPVNKYWTEEDGFSKVVEQMRRNGEEPDGLSIDLLDQMSRALPLRQFTEGGKGGAAEWLAKTLPRKTRLDSPGVMSRYGAMPGYDELFDDATLSTARAIADPTAALDKLKSSDDTYLLSILDELNQPKQGQPWAKNWVDNVPLAKPMAGYHTVRGMGRDNSRGF